MTILEQHNEKMVEKFDKVISNFGAFTMWDTDTDLETIKSFLLSNNKELVKRVYEDLLEKLPKEKELEHSLDFARRGYNCYLSEIKKLIKTLI